MKKSTITILGISLFIISVVTCSVILKLNNTYAFDDFLAKVCGGDSEEMKCVYIYSEYNPFTYRNTFYYQVTRESLMDANNKVISTVQKGSKATIDDVLKVAAEHDADVSIEIGRDTFIYVDSDNYKSVRKGDRISKEELLYIVKDLENE